MTSMILPDGSGQWLVSGMRDFLLRHGSMHASLGRADGGFCCYVTRTRVEGVAEAYQPQSTQI
jgi:hypothetical protein